MAKYNVKLLPNAYRDIDDIYGYIAEQLQSKDTAVKIVSSFEQAILRLEEYPYRGAERKVGIYANRGYRQLFVKNFTVVYRIDEKNKDIIIVTVKYSARSF